MDGSRLFNAVAATGIAASRITQNVDTVMFCLSKGLGAPVGSILAGSAGTIARARPYRRALGGAMRQAGVIAAPGLIALDEMRGRLAEDHRNAKRLALGLAQMFGIAIDADSVNTNIVICDVVGTGLSAERFIASLAERGVLVSRAGGTRIRMVTHLGVTDQDCDVALDAVRDVSSRACAPTARMQTV
jgi:threonine aldolase